MSHSDSKPDNDGQATPDDTGNPEQVNPEETDLDEVGSDTPLVPDTAADAAAAADGDHGETDGAHSIQDELAERTEDLQRVTAEYANFRRRTAREREALAAHAKTSVITEFLPVIDDLDLVDKHGDLSAPLKAVHDKLTATFTKLGVTRFGAPGDQFDPEIHEAVQDLSSGDDKVVGTVLRPGFMLGDKLVRTAMVIIADTDKTTGNNN